jgi:hypothetical protein
VDLRKLATILSVTGGLLVIAAIVWWIVFFGGFAEKYGQPGFSFVPGDPPYAVKIMAQRFHEGAFPFHCLFMSSGECVSASNFYVQSDGALPYQPALLWIGIGVLGGGLVTAASLLSSPERASSARFQSEDGRGPSVSEDRRGLFAELHADQTSAKPFFHTGDRVRHAAFGEGVVLGNTSAPDVLRVQFFGRPAEDRVEIGALISTAAPIASITGRGDNAT